MNLFILSKIYRLRISVQLSSFTSFLEVDVYGTVKALTKVEIVTSERHFPVRSFIDVETAAEPNHPAGVQPHLPVVQGGGELPGERHPPTRQATLQLGQLGLLLPRLVRVPGCEDSDLLKAGTAGNRKLAQPQEVDQLVVGPQVGILPKE